MIDSVNISEMEDINDCTDDTEIILDDVIPRYILDPFEIVLPNDYRYKNAFTREQISERCKK